MHHRIWKFGAGAALMLALGAVVAATERSQLSPPPSTVRAPPAIALSQVMSRVHFSFRDEGGVFVGGHTTYSARVERGSVELLAFQAPGVHGTPLRLSATVVTRGSRVLTDEKPVAQRDADGAMQLVRGFVVEHLANSEQGLTQSWEFAQRPEGHGDLVVRVPVDGRFTGSSKSGVHLTSGALGFAYGHATWVDADGARTPVPATWDGSGVVMRVPDALVRRSPYPAVLDPLVSPEIALDQPVYVAAANNQSTPAIAWNGTNYLVTWVDGRNGGVSDIYGTRLSSAGTVLDPAGILIASNSHSTSETAVASNGTDFLVVWGDYAGTGPTAIFGARVTGAGVALDPAGASLAFAGGTVDSMHPAIAWGSTSYLLVWEEYDSENAVPPDTIRGVRVDSNKTVIGSSFTISATDSYNSFPDVDWDGSNFLVVYQRNNSSLDIMGAFVSGSGVPSAPFAINASAGNAYLPTVAWNGSTHLVVWHDDRVALAYDIYGARVAANGTVTDSAGFIITNATGTQNYPDITAQGTTFMVAWADTRAGGNDIYGAQVSGSALVTPANGQVISSAAGTQMIARVASDGTSAVVAWVDYRTTPPGNSDIYGTMINSAGTVQSPSGVLYGTAANPQANPQVAFDGTNYLVVWEDLRAIGADIYATRVSKAGAVIDVGFPISVASNSQKLPCVTWTGAHYFVAWQDDRTTAGNFDIYGARVSTSGTVTDPSGLLINASANSQTAPAVANDGTNVLVVWQDDRITPGSHDIYGSRVGATGVVLEGGGVKISDAVGSQRAPSVAWNGSTYLAVWEDLRNSKIDIYGALISSSLVVGDPTGRVISAGTATRQQPSVAVNGSTFMVAWEDVRSGLTFDVYGTRVSSVGAVLDSPNLAISTAASDQRLPVIAGDGTHFQVVWQDHRAGLTNWDLYGGRVAAMSGALPDGQGVAISTALTDEQQPAIASAGARAFLVVYQAFVTGSANGLRARARTLANAAPVASAQSLSTNEDTALPLTLTGTDSDSDALTFVVVAGPTHGALTGSAPNLTYTPASQYNGADSFTFKVNDSLADSAAGTVSLTVNAVNDAPLALSQSVSTAEDVAASITLTGSDVENSALTYIVLSQPTHGSLSGSAPSLTYTPAGNYGGPDSFTFKVNDGTDDSVSAATVSLTINSVNDPPVANAQTLPTTEDTPLLITLGGTDVEGSPLTYLVVMPPSHGTLTGTSPSLTYTPAINYNGTDGFTYKANDGMADSPSVTVNLLIAAANDAPVAQDQALSTDQDTAKVVVLTATDVDVDALSYSIVAMPSHGTVTGTPPQVTYVPAAGYRGNDLFTFKANDGQQDSAPGTIRLSVAWVNHAPVVQPQAHMVGEDSMAAITVSAADEDADPLTMKIVDAPAHGAVSGVGPDFVYTPAPNFNGADFMTVKANDGRVDSPATKISFTVLPVNDLPSATTQAVQTSEDVSVSIVLTGSDVDGDALSFTIVDSPMHGVLSGNPPNVTLTPAADFNGTDALTFKVNDGTLDSEAVTVTVTVLKVNDPPTADAVTVSVVPDSAIAVTLSGRDPDGDALTFTVVTQPAHGTLSGSPPDLTYQPEVGFAGADELTFTVSDGVATSVVATVSLVVASAPSGPTDGDRSQINGWSCGCNQVDATGAWALMGAALWWLRRRPRVARTVVMVSVLCVSIAEAKTPSAKKAKPAQKAPPPAPAPAVTLPPEPPPPAPVVVKPVASTGPRSLAALNVTVTVPNETLDAAAFSEMMVSAVDQTQLFRVISTAEISTMLGVERQRQLLGCSEDSCLTELTDALGAQYVLQGSVGRVGENYLVTVRLIDSRRSSVVGRAALQTDTSSLLLKLVWQATQQAIDVAAEALPPDEAKHWRERVRPEPPVAATHDRSRLGVAVMGTGGYQPLSAAGSRLSVGGQVDVTWRIGRFDLGAGFVISPSPGGRVTVGFALLQARHRVSVAVRGAAFPLAQLFGGGPAVLYEFALTPMFGFRAVGAAEVYAGAPSATLALLAGLGAQAHF